MQPKSHNNQKGSILWLLLLFTTALVVVGVIVSIFVYKFAYQQGHHDANAEAKVSSDGVEFNNEGVKGIQLQNDILQNEADSSKQELDITLNNLVGMRAQIESLTTSNLQLQQTVKLYSKDLASQGGMPLQIIAAEIEPLPENAFEYRFDVIKLAADGKIKTLKPKLELINSTSFVAIPLEPKSYDIAGVTRIRGRFVMPDGFTPRQVKLTLKSEKDNVSQLYNWKFGSRKNNVPLSLAEVPEPDQRPLTH